MQRQQHPERRLCNCTRPTLSGTVTGSRELHRSHTECAAMIRHIVLWKLRAVDAATRSADVSTIVAALSALPALIPEIKALAVGSNVADHASNWDLGLVVDYANMADLDTYRTHPEHLKVVDIVKPLIAQRASVDIEIKGGRTAFRE
jgi:quinol monooxygenase YgiN